MPLLRNALRFATSSNRDQRRAKQLLRLEPIMGWALSSRLALGRLRKPQPLILYPNLSYASKHVNGLLGLWCKPRLYSRFRREAMHKALPKASCPSHGAIGRAQEGSMWWMWFDWWFPPSRHEVITVDFKRRRVVGRMVT